MSNNVTIARPYAKAVFKQAKSANTVDSWSASLEYLDVLTADQQMQAFIKSPKVSKPALIDAINQIAGDNITDEARNLVQLLVNNKRIDVLQGIRELFEQYRAQDTDSIKVQVTLAYPFAGDEENKLINALQTSLSKTVQLETNIDQSIMGGMIVKAGDQIIDGSVLGNLNRLEKIL